MNDLNLNIKDFVYIKSILQKLYEENNREKLKIKNLNVSGTSITSLTFLNNYIDFDSLQDLDCSNNNIIFIGLKIQLDDIRSLNCSFNKVPILDSIIKSIGVENNLTTLILEGCGLLSIEGLELMIHLKKLVLNDNKLYNIRELMFLKDLEYLDISKNNIIKVHPLEDLENLTTLNISQNNIHNISCLYNLTKLKYLDISINKKIISLNGVQNMSSLECIICDFCGIYSIIELTGNLNLKKISISSNNLGTIEDILLIPNLKELNIKYNEIKKFQSNRRYIDFFLSFFQREDPLIEKIKSIDVFEK